MNPPRFSIIIWLASIFFLSALISGCASKRYTKKADKFEEAGLYKDAAEYYYEAARKKDSNVDAKLGLRKNGQLVLEDKLDEFNRAYQQANYKEAVYKYRDAEDYYYRVKSAGVSLDFPEINKTHYAEAKAEYLQVRYSEGLDKLNREEFNEARIIFQEIVEIEHNYKDIKEKLITATYEPKYRDGLEYLENGYFRKAYYTFSEILTGAGSYKQSVVLMDQAREKATVSILVDDFSYASGAGKDHARDITSGIKGKLSSLDNPFIKIIERSSMNQNAFDGDQINLQAANLAGLKAVLQGRVDNVSLLPGNLIKTDKRGYIKEVTKIRNEAGEEIEKVNYHKTEYEEYEITNRSGLEMSFRLVSTENGEILVSDIYTLSNSDHAHYAKFEGDRDKLVPGYWKHKNSTSKEDVVKDNRSDVRDLQSLLRANRSVKPVTTLLNELIIEATDRMKNKIDAYNPEE
jgi:hypothetical protein